MKKIFSGLLLYICAVTLFAAEALPAKLEILTERTSHIYKKGEKAKFLISVKDKEGKILAGKKIQCVISTEKDRKSQVLTSKDTPLELEVFSDVAGSCSVTGTVVDAAGKSVLDSRKRKITAGSGAAFSLEEIFQGYPEEKDFDAFWDAKKKELAKVPMKVEYKDVDLKTWKKGTFKKYAGKIKVYDVKISCVGKVPVTGYFAMPVNAKKGKLPAIIIYHPYGVRSASIPVQYGEKAIAFDVNANGLENGREDSFYRNLANGKLKHYFYFGNTDRETIYFKDMYLRALRALEFMKSRPEWNKKDLIVTGYSQGGAQALAVAGLDKDVTLCIATCPALCDLGGVWAGRRSGWIVPRHRLEKGKNGKCVTKDGDKIIKATSYIDNANFAKRIKGEVHFSSGDWDTVCPMASVYAAYKNVPGKKTFTILKNMGHWGVNPEGYAALNKILNGQKNNEVKK